MSKVQIHQRLKDQRSKGLNLTLYKKISKFVASSLFFFISALRKLMAELVVKNVKSILLTLIHFDQK